MRIKISRPFEVCFISNPNQPGGKKTASRWAQNLSPENENIHVWEQVEQIKQNLFLNLYVSFQMGPEKNTVCRIDVQLCIHLRHTRDNFDIITLSKQKYSKYSSTHRPVEMKIELMN